jgi:radical SAM superfamily enzyme YgiQ (UPF0313 family)
MAEILLTADRSVMNNFHLKGHIAFPFYGSGEMFPNWLYKILVGKPKHKNGIVKYAPYPLRKIEACLLDAGFDVLTICPEQIKKHIKNARILGIHTVDPAGLASKPFFYEILKNNEQYSIKYLKELLEQPCIKKAKENDLKIIVGGQGAWQLKKNPQSKIAQIADAVVIGQGEKTVPQLCKNLIDKKIVPKYISSKKTQSPSMNEISSIQNASNFGCIEIGRGCNRCCKFCEVTKANLQWYPYSKIEEELKVNNRQGIQKGIIHAEDVLLYGQNGFIPDNEKMTELFKIIYKYYNKFIITHFSLAAVQSNRTLFKNLMEIVFEHQNFFIGEAGIETASTRLMKQTMSGKALPFKITEWKDIIKESLGLMHDNNFIPYCSLIVGLPGEKHDDVIQTLNLIDDLKDIRFILLPSGFTPLGEYTDANANKLSVENLDSLRKELVTKCANHNGRWVCNIAKIVLDKDLKYRLLSKIWYAQSYLKNMIT